MGGESWTWVEGRHRCKHPTPKALAWQKEALKLPWHCPLFADGETEFQGGEDLTEATCSDDTAHVYEAWFCAGNMTVIISMHPHYLTVITPLCRPVTCPGSPGCSWWQIWAQIVIGHNRESMLLTTTELKAPITLAECPP